MTDLPGVGRHSEAGELGGGIKQPSDGAVESGDLNLETQNVHFQTLGNRVGDVAGQDESITVVDRPNHKGGQQTAFSRAPTRYLGALRVEQANVAGDLRLEKGLGIGAGQF